eukprot:10013023-Ditylum_brightwellii.AAC.1
MPALGKAAWDAQRSTVVVTSAGVPAEETLASIGACSKGSVIQLEHRMLQHLVGNGEHALQAWEDWLVALEEESW